MTAMQNRYPSRARLSGIFLIALTYLLLTGCPSEQSVTTNTITPAPLSVVATSIGDGDSQIGTSPVLSATFSAAVDPATVNVSSFVLTDETGTPVDGNISFNADRTIASFIPDAPLAPKALYIATLTTAIRGANGAPLSGDYRLAFHTGAWTRQYGSAANESANDITTDEQGNIYLVGETSGAPDGTTNAGGKDAVLVQYRANGMRAWTRQLGSSADDIAHAVAVDANGNIFVAGDTNGTLAPEATVQGRDLFLARYDRDGNLLWVRQYGSAGDDIAFGLALDGSGNLYLAGKTTGALDGLTPAVGDDGFIMRLDTDGNPLWTRQIASGAGNEAARAIAIDSDGNACVTGSTNGDLDGNPAPLLNDVFLTCYDPNGNQLWLSMLRSIEGVSTESSAENARAITIDSSGNFYIAGDRFDLFGGATAGIDMLIAKFDARSNAVWVHTSKTSGTDLANDLLLDDQDNLYVTGQTDGVFTGQSSAGADDIILLKYDSNGSQQWVRQSGGAGYDVPLAMTRTADGQLLVSGQTDGALDGNTVIGGTDLFIRRYTPDGSLR